MCSGTAVLWGDCADLTVTTLQNDLQAMARCHRIGQAKEVTVYRLICKDTYEQSLFNVASRKYGGSLSSFTSPHYRFKREVHDSLIGAGVLFASLFSAVHGHRQSHVIVYIVCRLGA